MLSECTHVWIVPSNGRGKSTCKLCGEKKIFIGNFKSALKSSGVKNYSAQSPHYKLT